MRQPRQTACLRRIAAGTRYPTPVPPCGRGFPPRSPRPARAPARHSRADLLTRLEIVGWPKPIPNASGTRAHSEDRHRMGQRRHHQAGDGTGETGDERRFVAESLDDRPNHAALHDRAEHAEPGETVACLRRIEGKPSRREQRERRLEHRECEPVDEVDHEDAAEPRPPQQAGQRAKGQNRCLPARDEPFPAARARRPRSRQA